MKTKLLLSLLFVTTAAQAFEKDVDALIRVEGNIPTVASVTLTDLESEEAYDGKYFKIVIGKSSEAIRFDSDKELALKASTTYFHLTKARNYFVNKIKSLYVRNLPKMIIRLEHTNQFSELGHFTNDNYDPQYNNALTIPAGKGLASKGVKPWGTEIWFRPSKEIHLSEINVNQGQARQFMGLVGSFRNQIHMQSGQSIAILALTAMTNEGFTPTVDSVVRTVGSSLLIEAAYRFYDPITKVFSRKWYWLDSAMVPEIIYHEYSHVALADHLVLSHSTPIIEGMADFFAGEIAESITLAKNIKQYNTYTGRSARKKTDYELSFETGDYAHTDFVFSLLWEMKTLVGEESAPAFMYELRKKLSTNSQIRGGLVEGLLKNCQEMCNAPFNDKIRILKALNQRGI